MERKEINQYGFFRNLTNQKFVDGVYLYGSRGRGDNTMRSDIDLAIDCPNATLHDWNIILDIIDNADTLLEIDCVRLDELENDDPFKINIINQAKLLYKKL